MSGFLTRHIFCHRVMWTLKITSSIGAHPMSAVCIFLHSLKWLIIWLPFLNISSLYHFDLRTIVGIVQQSTITDMSRCIVSSEQHLVDRKWSDWLVDLQWWAYSPELNSPDFYKWGYLKDRVYTNNSQSIPELKTAITATIKEISRKKC